MPARAAATASASKTATNAGKASTSSTRAAKAVAETVAKAIAKRAAKPYVAPAEEPLKRYREKRDFSITSEPPPRPARRRTKQLAFVIQKHWASRLHYDFRLEMDGVMWSWAVPKGPSFDPAIKQMAIHVEDHPISYNRFEGRIPAGQYGAGTVIVWDNGTWEPLGDAHEGMAQGKIIFKLHGQKLAGLWELVRISRPEDKKQEQWLLLKKRGDAWARPSAEYDVISALPDSVTEKPLGLVEDREPERSAPASTTAKGAATKRDGNGAADAVKTDLERAPKASLPAKIEPQLATLVAAAPAGQWVVETKFDGYRLLARIDHGTVRLFTRNGNDWTSKLKPVADAVGSLGLDRAWLDGEIVVLNERGLPDFNRLQNSIDAAKAGDITYFVFDLLHFDGRDLRPLPVASRRALLEQILADGASDRVRFSEAFPATGAQMLEAACKMGMEGIMLKRADAPYRAGRGDTWLKLKCQLRQEFVVVGFTNRSGAAREVGALLLGYHDGAKLIYAGSVGTGWSAATGRELHDKLAAIEVDKPAVTANSVKPGRWSKRPAGTERWVRPTTVVEVAFAEWTPDGQVRHATFRGVRDDKPASSIVRETAATLPGPQATLSASGAVPAVKVTHPERVIDASTGLTKLQLVRYYESVAEWMLPHLKGRPVSLVRAPTGIAGELFFQKHLESKMPGVEALDEKLWPGHPAMLAIPSVQALAAAAQMNVVEFHTWNSTVDDINHPDRVIFDLDPGEGVKWDRLKEAALLVHALLDELGQRSWLKTSGGKGLHVVVPLDCSLDYDTVKRFSQAAVAHMARTIPDRFVAKSGPSNRVGKIFIDYLRNGFAQTTAAAFSARARPGLGVSMPVSWEQLKDLKSGSQWTIATAREYLSFQREDPWRDYWSTRQSAREALEVLAPGKSGRR